MIIAVDFDGTLADDSGNPNGRLFRWLEAKQRSGDIIILWTCRAGERLEEAIRFCAQNGLRFNLINENAPGTIAQLKYNPRKILADIYIDDKAVKP